MFDFLAGGDNMTGHVRFKLHLSSQFLKPIVSCLRRGWALVNWGPQGLLKGAIQQVLQILNWGINYHWMLHCWSNFWCRIVIIQGWCLLTTLCIYKIHNATRRIHKFLPLFRYTRGCWLRWDIISKLKWSGRWAWIQRSLLVKLYTHYRCPFYWLISLKFDWGIMLS